MEYATAAVDAVEEFSAQAKSDLLQHVAQLEKDGKVLLFLGEAAMAIFEKDAVEGFRAKVVEWVVARLGTA